MSKSEILKQETEKLLNGVDAISERFVKLGDEPIDTLTEEPLFFDVRSLECVPLILNCTLSLEALPPTTPVGCKITRSQYEDIKDRLGSLKVNFSNLQDSVEETLAGNVSALATITDSIFSILEDFIFIKLECEKIKNFFIL